MKNIIVSIILFFKAITCDLVPLQSFEGSKFSNNIIETPIFIINWYGGSLGGFKILIV